MGDTPAVLCSRNSNRIRPRVCSWPGSTRESAGTSTRVHRSRITRPTKHEQMTWAWISGTTQCSSWRARMGFPCPTTSPDGSIPTSCSDMTSNMRLLLLRTASSRRRSAHDRAVDNEKPPSALAAGRGSLVSMCHRLGRCPVVILYQRSERDFVSMARTFTNRGSW